MHLPKEIKPAEGEPSLLAQVEQKVEIIPRIITLLLKLTKPQDWVDFHGQPYLTGSGAERIRMPLGIKMIDADWKVVPRVDKEGKTYEMVIFTGKFKFRDDDFIAVGVSSTRDQFFKVRYNKETGKKELLPYEEVDFENVLKASYTDMIRNAVVRVLGLRNLSWEQLEEAGLDVSKIKRVEFESRKREEQKKATSRSSKSRTKSSQTSTQPRDTKSQPQSDGSSSNNGLFGENTEGPTPKVSKAQIDAIRHLKQKLNWTDEQLTNVVFAKTGKELLEALNFQEAGALITDMQQQLIGGKKS